MSNAEGNRPDPSQWRVLVVEDEYDSIQMVSKILSHHGAEVRVAHDGHECITILRDFSPTLVIMDLALPGMDGWETLRLMRAEPSTAGIPVVAITAYHSVSVEDDAHEAGFNGYLPKPLDMTTLIDTLAKVIRR